MTLVGKPIDILFLNAGRYQLKPALQTDIEEVRNILRINFESPVELAHTLMTRDMWKDRGQGHIVVTSSLMGRGGHSLSSSYSASKHALRGYFHTLATEEQGWLRVDVVCPGAVSTNMWQALDKDLLSNEGDKIKVDRLVRLMLTGVVGPYFLFYETWISKFAGILWIFLASYAPSLHHMFIHVLALARLAVWNDSGGQVDELNVPNLLWALVKYVGG